MDTDYRTLNRVEQARVLESLEGQSEELIEQVTTGQACCFCWMTYYNCLCGHED